MKKVFALCGLALLLLPILCFATTLTVQVAQAQMRGEPSFFGRVLANVGYQSPVELIRSYGDWRLVRFGQLQGWMHISTLANSSLNLRSDQSVSGKGFDAEMEQLFKQNHANLSFIWVDYMEQIYITPVELRQFVTESNFPTASR
jgi:hypothetical protein